MGSREKFVRSWFIRPHCSIQGDVLTIGSFDRVLSGKTYNRAVRVNKLVHEQMHRLLLNQMEDSTQHTRKSNDFYENTTQVSHKDFIECNFFEQFNNAVSGYKLCVEVSSDLAKFWLTYLTMINLLLNTWYVTSTGDYWSALGILPDRLLHAIIITMLDT